jgi:hypothetical protein
VDELILVTVCYHYADRLDSYRRLAQAFELTTAQETAP